MIQNMEHRLERLNLIPEMQYKQNRIEKGFLRLETNLTTMMQSHSSHKDDEEDRHNLVRKAISEINGDIEMMQAQINKEEDGILSKLELLNET